MDRLLLDLTYAVRRLRQAPGFTTVALLTLALGIGANTAIFSIVHAVLLQPLPYRDADRVVAIWRAGEHGGTTWLSGPEVKGYGAITDVFSDVAAYTTTAANLTGADEPERVVAAVATPNLFRVFGVPLLHGRGFTADETGPPPADVVILGHELWRRRFGGDPRILGQAIQVNGRARIVIGVLPASFRLPRDFREERPTELWTPMSGAVLASTAWGDRSLITVARLANAVSPEAATAALSAAESRWVREGVMREESGIHRRAIPVREFIVGDIRPALLVLVAAVSAILLIACANVANLVLARADDRRREIALRTALGASRGALIRQLLTESLLLSALGGVLGIAVALAGTRLLAALHPAGIPRIGDVGLDATVLAFASAVALATAVLFGLAPALELTRRDVSVSLKDAGRTGTGSRATQRFRDSLAVVQIAFSVMLLIGAMLLVRSFTALRQVDLGFSTRDALTLRLTLPPATYPQPADVIAFYPRVLDRLAGLPGVRSVGATRLLPLTGTIGDWSITLEGRERRAEENPNGDWQVVTPGYFETMDIPVVRGRRFTAADDQNAPPSAVINEAMAERYWPGEDALGKRFHLGTANQPWVTVVGIVRAVRHNAVVEEPRAEMYIPHAQFAAAGGSAQRGMTIILRTAGDPLALLDGVRSAIRALDPNLPIADVRTLERIASDSLSRPRFTAALLGLFATLAVVLAAIGIYGVVSLLVRKRRREIGVRMALGATRGSILRMVVRRGFMLAAIGLALGLSGAAGMTSALKSLLFGVTQFDALTFAAAPVLLLLITVLACMIPAARASAVDPVAALRDD